MKKIKIYKASDMQMMRWFNFNKEYHGYRFERDGDRLDKFEVFAIIENHQDTKEHINQGLSNIKRIKSTYHKSTIKQTISDK